MRFIARSAQKHRIIVIAVGFIAITVMTVGIMHKRGSYSSRSAATIKRLDDLDVALNALVIPPLKSSITNESQREAFSKIWKNRQQAVAQLRTMGTNVWPQLTEKVRAALKSGTTNPDEANHTATKLIQAFEILQCDAQPLLPMLIEEFRANRSPDLTVAGMRYIGGTYAGLILVEGLTNADRRIRNAVLNALQSFSTNREVSLAAVSPAVMLLHDNGPFSRALASSLLGSLHICPESVVPALLELAEHDPDFVVRVMAIKAIGRFGTNAISVRPNLEIIATSDRERSVRRIASVAIRAAQGEIAPDSFY